MPNLGQIFKEVALRPGEIAKIAAENKMTVEELLKAINNQSRTVNPNYDWARRAKDALGGQARTAAADAAAQAEREAARRAAQAKAQQEAERKAVIEATKRSAAQKARREGVKAGGKALVNVGQKELVKQGAKWGLKRILGVIVPVVGVALTLLTVWEILQLIRSASGHGAEGTPTPCPPLVTEYRKCPWTPDGYTVEACGPGYCWDGGPQGALACKQEQDVENSGRTYTTDLVCSEGYVAERDPCTNVILRCVQQ
jgi:F0F1-type ATP synthase membrane subunit b/b'